MNDSAPKYVPQNSRRSLNEKNIHIPPRYSQSSAQKRPPPSLLSLPFHTPVKPPLPFNTSAQHMMPSSSLKFQSIPQDPFVNQGYLKPRTLGGYYVQPPKNIPAGQLARSNSLGSGTGNSWR
uniref:Uncharacterized protein n=1 Tax=Panagrolaimus sp. ES5 TaxID=591445 RepID=A0AC34G414_9BILA